MEESYLERNTHVSQVPILTGQVPATPGSCRSPYSPWPWCRRHDTHPTLSKWHSWWWIWRWWISCSCEWRRSLILECYVYVGKWRRCSITKRKARGLRKKISMVWMLHRRFLRVWTLRSARRRIRNDRNNIPLSSQWRLKFFVLSQPNLWKPLKSMIF